MKKYFLSIILFIALVVISILYINSSSTNNILGYKADTYWGWQKNAHLLLNRIIDKQSHVVWSTGNHTATLVPLGALGPEKYTKKLKGLIDNTQIAKVLKEAVSDNVNVILVIGDGMGPNQMSIAIYKNIAEENGEKTYFEKIMNEGESAFVTNNPFGEIIGSSASTATSIACGIKTRVGMLGVDPEGFPVESVLEVAQKNGFATGVVSDAKIIDATPAAFYGHTTDRYDEKHLTAQLVHHKMDVVLGGGGSFFIPKGKHLSEMKGFEDLDPSLDKLSFRKDSINYLDTLINMDYNIVNTFSELNKLENTTKRVVGFFSGESMSSILERNKSKTDEPTLYDIATKAVNILSASGKGYFLMIESARIDIEAHDNDAGSVFHLVTELNNILHNCYDQYSKHPNNTLIVFTADHETGGMAFSYYGVPGNERKPVLLKNGQEYTRTKSSLTFDEFKNIYNQDLPVFKIFSEAQNSDELFKLLNTHLPYKVSREDADKIFDLLGNYNKGK